jgi:methionyl-tRNA formyltransferase
MSARLKVVFMGTPEFAVGALDAVARQHDIVAVYTQPDRPVGRGMELKAPPVKRRALELGLPVFQPEKLSLPGEWERLQAFAPDVIVVVAYGQILRQNILDLPRLGCVNIHSSLLPRWRGAAPIQWAILEGDRESGVSTMRLVLKLDAGEVLLQESTPVSPTETAGSLHDRLAEMGARLILPTLEGLASGMLQGSAQDESQVTYASKLTKEMEILDPSLGAEVLDRRVRALNPWPGTSLWLSSPKGGSRERLKVRQAVPALGLSLSEGFLHERDGKLALGCRGGVLFLERVQLDGKKETDSASFLNGLRGRGFAFPLRVDWKLDESSS